MKNKSMWINNGDKHIVSNIYPHMKCNLIFNYIDKMWDCPCHALVLILMGMLYMDHLLIILVLINRNIYEIGVYNNKNRLY